MNLEKIIKSLSFCLIFSLAQGQNLRVRPNIGPSALLGDLGGNFEQAKNNILDYDLKSTGVHAGVDFMFGFGQKSRFSQPNNYLVFGTNFSLLRASDLESENEFKIDRGFECNVICVEANVLFEKQFSPQNLRSNSKNYFIPSIFFGTGVNYSSPSVKEKGNTTYTENIGSTTSLQFPFGIGLAYQLGNKQRVGLQLYSVKSTSDLVDGVSNQGNPNNFDNHILLKINYSAILEKGSGRSFFHFIKSACPKF